MLEKIDKAYWVVLLIISLIVGIILGFIGPNMIHHILFKHGETFYVLTPFLSNILMLVAVGCFVLFCIGMLFEKKKWNYTGLGFLVISILISYFANFGNYTLFSEQDITFKKMLTKEVYHWKDIQEASLIEEYIKKGNTTVGGNKQFYFTFTNNKEVELEIPDRNIANKIKHKLAEFDIDLKTE
ncbi:hypothetical protein [Bacillus sinesaloumensis]|uniref:hypothetical protein n=1 Tax=Litchfieldia sinesaloumensis TaxID=1926280 RepID=UPI0009888FFE|nr:hypothetical protein [Bacillus sinesaloumensis]